MFEGFGHLKLFYNLTLFPETSQILIKRVACLKNTGINTYINISVVLMVFTQT